MPCAAIRISDRDATHQTRHRQCRRRTPRPVHTRCWWRRNRSPNRRDFSCSKNSSSWGFAGAIKGNKTRLTRMVVFFLSSWDHEVMLRPCGIFEFRTHCPIPKSIKHWQKLGTFQIVVFKHRLKGDCFGIFGKTKHSLHEQTQKTRGWSTHHSMLLEYSEGLSTTVNRVFRLIDWRWNCLVYVDSWI